ncbi:claspin [Folsomia candida]|uniref:claspin n=1 Tax=Folsomia candida TaxID=158441 RepID=UPI000B8F19F7|nr:claspin [Folsomia candida]
MELSILSEMENISNLHDPPQPEVEAGDFLLTKSPSPLPAAEDNEDLGADQSDNDNMVIAEEKSDDDDEDRNISFRSKKKTRFITSDDEDEDSDSPHKSPEKSRSPSPSSLSPPSDVHDSADDEQLLDIPSTTYGRSSSFKNRRQVSSPTPPSPPKSQERSAFSLKTLDPDIYGDDSEEEVRSLHSYHGGNSSDSDHHRENDDNENEQNNKKTGKTKKKRKEPLPKRKASEKARETMMKELASKTQKMVRESRIELPYHKPKQLTLDEFLKRRNRARAPLLESLVQSGENLGCGARNGISMEEDVLPILAEVEKDDEEIRRNKELADMLEKVEPIVVLDTLPMSSPLGDNVEMEVNDEEKQVIPSEDHHQEEEGVDLVNATIVTEEKDDVDKGAKEMPSKIDNDDIITDEVKQLVEEPVITFAQDDAINTDKKTEDNDNPPTFDEPLVVVEPENQTVVIPSSPIKNQEDDPTPNITTTLEDPTSTFIQDEAALNAFLSENKPKPKKLTIKEMIMRMPGYDKIAQMKPVIGGVRKGFRVNPNEIIDLRDDLDKNKPSKNAKAMDTLISRFAKHACAGASSNVEDSKPQHYKLHVNKIEKDSQGMLHSVVDDIDYVSTPVDDDLDIITKITRTTGSSPREQVPGEKMFRLKKALKDSIRAKKAKEYEERIKLHSMYNDELEFKDDLPDDEIILDDEEGEGGVSSEEDEEDDEEFDEEEEEEEDVEVVSGTKKKRKRLLYVDDEAEDEDGDQMSSSDDDDVDDIDGDDEGDVELEDVENSQSQSSKVENSEDTTDFKSQIPKTVVSDLASQSQPVDQIAQLLSKTGNAIDAKDLDLSNLCSGRFPSQEVPLTPFESQAQDCFGFDEDDDEELGNMSLTSYATTPGTGASNINNDTSIVSIPIVGDAEEAEIDLNESKSATEKKSDETPKRNHNSIFEEDIENASDNDDIVQQPKKIKPKRLHFSDDEEENDDKNEIETSAMSSHDDNDENETNDVPDEIPNYDDEDDDEEAEFERQLIRQKEQQKAKPKGLFGANGLLRKKFVEHEADLSGSDDDSGDEDEQGLNFYEQEDGDDEELDEDAVRTEIERAHLKHLLDKDDMEIRDLQYEFLEKGDLEDGKQRERKFRWTDVDDAWGDDHAMMGDFDGDGVGEEETEEDAKQRIAEIERRKWINENSQMLEATEEESQRSMFENSKFLKLGRTTKKKIESFIENSSSSFMMMNESSNSVQQDASFSALIKSKITGNPQSFLSASKLTNNAISKDEEDSVKLSSKSQPLFASPDDPCSKMKRGSFLSRGSPSLTRLAEITKLNVPKANDITSNVKNNSRNFVFSVITPPDQASKQNNKAAKRPAHSQGAQPKKFVKMDRSFSNMDDSSKDASIFKWF